MLWQPFLKELCQSHSERGREVEVNNNNITEGYMDKFVDILKGNTYLFKLYLVRFYSEFWAY